MYNARLQVQILNILRIKLCCCDFCSKDSFDIALSQTSPCFYVSAIQVY